MDSIKLNITSIFHREKEKFKFLRMFILGMWGKKSASFFRSIQIYDETISNIRKSCCMHTVELCSWFSFRGSHRVDSQKVFFFFSFALFYEHKPYSL